MPNMGLLHVHRSFSPLKSLPRVIKLLCLIIQASNQTKKLVQASSSLLLAPSSFTFFPPVTVFCIIFSGFSVIGTYIIPYLSIASISITEDLRSQFSPWHLSTSSIMLPSSNIFFLWKQGREGIDPTYCSLDQRRFPLNTRSHTHRIKVGKTLYIAHVDFAEEGRHCCSVGGTIMTSRSNPFLAVCPLSWWGQH